VRAADRKMQDSHAGTARDRPRPVRRLSLPDCGPGSGATAAGRDRLGDLEGKGCRDLGRPLPTLECRCRRPPSYRSSRRGRPARLPGEHARHATLIAEDAKQAREMAAAETKKDRPREWSVAVLEPEVAGPPGSSAPAPKTRRLTIAPAAGRGYRPGNAMSACWSRVSV
jgi:hypothetical protein